MKVKILISLLCLLTACSSAPEYIVVTATPEAITPTVPTPIVITATLDASSSTSTPVVITATPGPFMPTMTAIPMVPLVIAVMDIPAGLRIQPESLTVILFPAQYAPSSAFTNVEEVAGMYAVADIYREEIVLAREITDNTEYESYISRNVFSIIIVTADFEAGEFLDETDIALAFYDRQISNAFTMQGLSVEDFVSSRSDALRRTLNQALSAFEPIPVAALSGGE